MTKVDRGPAGPVAEVVATVGAWEGISVVPHRYGGTAFRLGSREIGHVHESGGVDIAFTRRVRDRLVGEGMTDPHHVYPDSGWTTFRVRSAADVDHALALLALSYRHHRHTLDRRAGRRHVDSPDPSRPVLERAPELVQLAGDFDAPGDA